MTKTRITIQTPFSTATSSGKQVGKRKKTWNRELPQVLVKQMIGRKRLNKTSKIFTQLNMHSILLSTSRLTSRVQGCASGDSSGLLCLSLRRAMIDLQMNVQVKFRSRLKKMESQWWPFYLSHRLYSLRHGLLNTLCGSNLKNDRYTFPKLISI